MILVAFETSTVAGGVALSWPGGVLSRDLPPGPQSESLLPALDELLAWAGLARGEVGGLAVGIGPGAFTGLRVGLATAQGWARASGIPLAPVVSLDALAWPLLTAGRPVLAVSDARKGELYASFYPGLTREHLPDRRGEVALLRPQQIIAWWEDLAGGKVEAEVAGTGTETARPFLAAFPCLTFGDGAARPSAASVAGIGARLLELGRGVGPARLLPCYVRPPDARTMEERGRP